jgi:hypothetical protein
MLGMKPTVAGICSKLIDGVTGRVAHPFYASTELDASTQIDVVIWGGCVGHRAGVLAARVSAVGGPSAAVAAVE